MATADHNSVNSAANKPRHTSVYLTRRDGMPVGIGLLNNRTGHVRLVSGHMCIQCALKSGDDVVVHKVLVAPGETQ